MIESAKLLIVDDDEGVIRLISAVLQHAGYARLNSLTDPREFQRIYAELKPDLILMDILMPHLNGLSVVEALQCEIPLDNYVPILFLSADTDPSVRARALSIGAKDFLSKPFNPAELVARVRNLVEARLLYIQIRGLNRSLAEKVKGLRNALEHAGVEMAGCLAKAASYRDDDTGQHAQRVGCLAHEIALAMGFSQADARLLQAAAALHDIGKIGIPDRILLKPGKLTQEEFDQIRTHTAIGAEILSHSQFSILKLAEEIAAYHHERWDGGGYNGRRGETIPVAARIVTLADTFDVLTHDRPYRTAWSVDEAITEILRQRCLQFDPGVVDAFLSRFVSRDLCALSNSVAASCDLEPSGENAQEPVRAASVWKS
jgi:putative two-component system response regulator